MRRIRRELRTRLTPGERAVAYCWILLTFVIPPLAIGLLLLGGGGVRPVGIGLLLASLLLYAVPISPILKARVRRREQRSGSE